MSQLADAFIFRAEHYIFISTKHPPKRLEIIPFPFLTFTCDAAEGIKHFLYLLFRPRFLVVELPVAATAVT